MSQLSDAIDEIENEQLERSRVVCMIDHVDDPDAVDAEEAEGIDVVVLSPDNATGLIARIGWGEGDIVADLRVFIDGALQAHDSVALDGVTSIWATRS